MERVEIHTEYIRLDQLLKLVQVVQGGGEAKLRIQSGEILVNEQVELRRGRKLRPGDRVSAMGEEFEVVAEEG